MSQKSGRLNGWRAMVTGASSGIGSELAQQLAELGADLVITARRKDRLDALANEVQSKHGVDVRVIDGDLTEPDFRQRLFEETENNGLTVDILFNNAGLGNWNTFLAEDWATHQLMIDLDITALTDLCYRFAPAMVRRGRGHIVNIASLAAYFSIPNFAVYGGAKAYVRNFTEALHSELKPHGVRALAVCPGGVETEFSDRADQRLTTTGKKSLMSAKACARISIRKMLAGRRNVITGLPNVLTALMLRILPRPWGHGIVSKSMALGVEQPKALPNIE